MNKMFTYIGGIFVFIIGLFSLFLFGKNKGKQEERQKNIEDNLNAANEFKKDNDAINSSDDNDLRNQLLKDARN